MASELPGARVDRAAGDGHRVDRRGVLAKESVTHASRILVVLVGGIALLHRDGFAGPKALYLAVVVAVVAAAVPSARALREDPARASEWRLVRSAALFGALVALSLAVALRHGSSPVTWMRDASVYGLFAAAPLLALDLRRDAGLRWVRWTLVAAGSTCTASFAVEWIALRGFVDLPVETILLPSFYLPAGLLAYSTARGLRGGSDAIWWLLATAVAGASHSRGRVASSSC